MKFCLSVRHHFSIYNLGKSNHPRIMSDPIYILNITGKRRTSESPTPSPESLEIQVIDPNQDCLKGLSAFVFQKNPIYSVLINLSGKFYMLFFVCVKKSFCNSIIRTRKKFDDISSTRMAVTKCFQN